MFYKSDETKNITNIKKIVPLNIGKYFTDLSLAILFMNSGSKLDNRAIITINCFSYEEICFLCEVLKIKFNITATTNKNVQNNRYIIYIHESSMLQFSQIIKPYMIPSLYYKLGNY